MTDAVVDPVPDGAPDPARAEPARRPSLADRLPGRRERGAPIKWREVGLAALFLAPSLAVFVAFFYLPFVRLLGWGTYTSVRGGSAYRSVGMDQYREVLGGSDFRSGLGHTLMYVLMTAPIGLLAGILLAVVANRQLRGIRVFQTIFSSTIASSAAVSAVVFFYLFNPAVGLVQVNWLNEKGWSLFAAALPSIWQNLGLAFVIVLAGLQAIPEEVQEAATLERYTPWRRLTRITLPLISPVLMFLVVVLVINGFQAFATIDILTGGGPAGSSETLVFKIFDETQNYGRGAVLAVGLFAVTLIVTFAQFVLLERRVHYDS